jgi:hypothetical protein
MAGFGRQSAPGWFTIVAALLVLWGMAGCASFYAHVAYGADMDPKATDWDRAYYAALPAWLNLVYLVAVAGGLLGSVALLLSSAWARPLAIASLGAVIVQFGYVFAATDLIAHKGAAATVPFPAVIAAIAMFQIWFAGLARRRGWIS